MVHMHVLQPAQMPLMLLSSASPHQPFGVGNYCASQGKFAQTHTRTERAKPMEIILIWITNILIGIYVLPHHLSEVAVFIYGSSSSCALLTSQPYQPPGCTQFSLRASQAVQSLPRG